MKQEAREVTIREMCVFEFMLEENAKRMVMAAVMGGYYANIKVVRDVYEVRIFKII